MSTKHWVAIENRRRRDGAWVRTDDCHRGPFDEAADAHRAAGLADSFNDPNTRHVVWSEDLNPNALEPALWWKCALHGELGRTGDGSYQDHATLYHHGVPPTVMTLPAHDCGYPEDTFACKIRHVSLNTGDAKAARDGQVARSRLRGIETTG